MSSIILPLKSCEDLVQFLEDQMEITRALPLSKETETRIGHINKLLEQAKLHVEIKETLNSLFDLL